MKTVVVQKASINPDALDGALKAALGSVYHQFVGALGSITVTLTDEATAPQEEQTRQIVAAHDPAAKTDAQQAKNEKEILEAVGATVEKMLWALWRKVVEGKSDADSGVADLLASIAKIPKRIPPVE